MQAHNIVLPEQAQPDSNRFLANHIHLLIHPCGELDLETKCCLVSHHIPKYTFRGFNWPMYPELSEYGLVTILDGMRDTLQISIEFLEEVTSCLSEEGTCRSVLLHDGVEKRDCSTICNDFEEMGMIAFDAMQRANSTLEDFCRSYFMFHDLDVNRPQSIFRYLPLLSFTESFIYQLDNSNEKLLQLPSSLHASVKKGSFVVIKKVPHQNPKSMEAFKTQPFRPLTLLLDRNGLLTERIRQELLDGEEYWALERVMFCIEEQWKDNVYHLAWATQIAVEDAMRAIHLKSFDYRVLNLLLFQLREEKVNELHMEFLSASEFLVEIADDLFDYEEDVLENSFNILRMFVRIYGPSMAKTMMAKCICEGEEKYNHLLKKLDPQLASEYQRRCEEATKEGGKILGPALGSWNIPAVIADEEFYRSNLSNHSALLPD